MTKITRLAKEYSEPSTAQTNESGCVYLFDNYTANRQPAPAGYKKIGQLVARAELDPERKAAIADARRWLAEKYHNDDGGKTIRALRLERGLSQQQLAQLLATSQPYVARIESGRANVTIVTCRKLSEALEVDINTIDSALLAQDRKLSN